MAGGGAGGGGADENFYVVDDETGETITIAPKDYWNIVQRVITAQNTGEDGTDFTYNESFKLTDTQMNALVAKEWKKHYTPPGKTEEANDPKELESFATEADLVMQGIIADPNLKTPEDRRTEFGKYIDERAKELKITISKEQREAMLKVIQ